MMGFQRSRTLFTQAQSSLFENSNYYVIRLVVKMSHCTLVFIPSYQRWLPKLYMWWLPLWPRIGLQFGTVSVKNNTLELEWKIVQLEAVTDFNPMCREHRAIQITVLQPRGFTCMQISKGRHKWCFQMKDLGLRLSDYSSKGELH